MTVEQIDVWLSIFLSGAGLVIAPFLAALILRHIKRDWLETLDPVVDVAFLYLRAAALKTKAKSDDKAVDIAAQAWQTVSSETAIAEAVDVAEGAFQKPLSPKAKAAAKVKLKARLAVDEQTNGEINYVGTRGSLSLTNTQITR